MNDYVKSDLMRYYGKYDTRTFIKAYMKNSTFRFQYAFRMSQCSGFAKIWGGGTVETQLYQKSDTIA